MDKTDVGTSSAKKSDLVQCYDELLNRYAKIIFLFTKQISIVVWATHVSQLKTCTITLLFYLSKRFGSVNKDSVCLYFSSTLV